MGANAGSTRLPWLAAIFAVALLALLLVMVSGESREEAKEAAPLAPAPSGASASPTLRASPRAGMADVGRDGDAEAAAPHPAEDVEPPGATEVVYPVNLDELRARLPDNLYWQLGAPTKDPLVVQQRAEEKQRWNELFGKVQSNTASEEEIRRYYDHRRRVSEDYLEFSTLVLKEYGDKLPERDRGMYELSITMHRGRLDEIPRQIDDALARKKAHDQRRDEWRRTERRD